MAVWPTTLQSTSKCRYFWWSCNGLCEISMKAAAFAKIAKNRRDGNWEVGSREGTGSIPARGKNFFWATWTCHTSKWPYGPCGRKSVKTAALKAMAFARSAIEIYVVNRGLCPPGHRFEPRQGRVLFFSKIVAEGHLMWGRRPNTLGEPDSVAGWSLV